jgi:hypothetical protein
VPSSDTYRGTAPASEEETQIMKALQLRYNIAKLLDYHSSGREVLFSFQCEPIPAILDTYIEQEATKLAALATYATRPPSADGQNQEWTIGTLSAYAFLVETATEFQPPFAQAQAEAERVWPLALAWLNRVIPLSGHVTGGGRPVGASIAVRELGVGTSGVFTYRSDPTYGRYHLWLPDGTYTLVVSAAGFATRNVTATVNNAAGGVLDIAL